MAEPARKPDPAPSPASAPDGVRPSTAETPRLRPRRLREAESRDAPQPGGARGLQTRLTDAFTRRSNTALEALLMRLIIVAATCCILASAAGEGGPISGLFR